MANGSGSGFSTADGQGSLEWRALFDSRANALLLNPRLGSEARERFQLAWQDLVADRFEAQVGIATSGSSGEGTGRLILLSHAALEASARAVNHHLRATSEDVWFKTLPEFHVGGLGILVRASLNGARVADSDLTKWRPATFHAELSQKEATLLSLVPTQLHDLVAAGFRSPPKLRAVVIGGARLSEELYRRARALGWPVLPSYGMTEVCSQVATAELESLVSSPGASSGVSAGPQLPRMKVLEHVRVSGGDAGSSALSVSSPSLLTGMVILETDGDSEPTAVFRDPKTRARDGSLWFRTEDRGRVESDGSLTVLGRGIDFVKIGGEGVVLSRLEEALVQIKLEHGFTGEAEVLAAADERLGAAIVLVTEAGELEVRALTEAFNSRMMPFERIRTVHRLEKMPRSPLGKLLRFQALAAVGLKPVENL